MSNSGSLKLDPVCCGVGPLASNLSVLGSTLDGTM